jgi:hypothetical protein
MRRKQRQPKVVAKAIEAPSDESWNDSSDEDSEKKPPAKKKVIGIDRILECDNKVIPEDMTDEQMEEKIAFCCYECICDDEKKNCIDKNNKFVQSQDGGLYHRRCCHNVIDEPEYDWCSQYEKASADTLNTKNVISDEEFTLSPEEFNQYVRKGNLLQARVCNEDGKPGL